MDNRDMVDNVQFARMNGLGNKILVVDMRGRRDRVTPQAAISLNADPATAFDQIMAIHDPKAAGTDAWIDIVNSDGSMAQACGNGTRCVVQALAAETGKKAFLFHTVAGLLEAKEHDDGTISVDMGSPRFGWDEIPLSEEFHDTRRIELQIGPIDNPVLHSPSVASMGNPHAIFWVDNDVWSYDLERFGPLLENHPMFPERANISIARVLSRNELDLRTWERGAGLTLACGSAACAAAVSAARTDRTDRRVIVNVPGGPLSIEWREADDHVVMTGPAEWEWSGTVDPATGAWQRDETQPGTAEARAL
ncbi:diaminopimelate epimerase [Ensifer sp. T173]|uniref:Diaminopimelate epimerase n=2 Tax=Sinorhizobium/Ensifer group TaxID=227292 RepID=A0AAW4FQQ9_9HYPH|nr:diaminopimelate epimerase [Ensifer adhaerens OV14]KQW34485.1 diaminopimelate epimerase [Ensifer sp. Root1252]KQW56273.1 diaminopimelate epimerase [Ensifer sp. Root127]KQY61640.1 diaminopimelate epimerase [Ensifer sp. Root142]KRC55353.1 diaminopimelate epimerase [Ensifer sp. Root231]KRC87177.1 diaminopimelate epimerase [Ensifer sp. Root258]MBM3093672.1 diaminopimelate epimerase [Ensifer canadensis]OMQ42591.1 diaminopimelate epimerase [Ensifer sp. 1H6]PSS63515.1 diaminopimelate epimerase [